MQRGRTERPLLAVIVPALDESRTVGEVVERTRVALSALESFSVAIIVVDDGSSDTTGRDARAAGADLVLTNPATLGLGAAVRKGLDTARGLGAEIIVKVDADLQHSPEDIPALVAPIAAGEADLVFGDRFERIDYRMPFVRRLGNRVFSGLMRWLTGWPVRDSQPGIFAGSRRYLDGFRIPDDYNYTQQVLIDGYQRSLRFMTVPVSFRERMSGASFVSLRYLWRVPWAIAKMVVSVGPHASTRRPRT